MKRSLKYGERDYSFGQVMVTLRTAIGMTQVELAEFLGVSRRAVQGWEGGISYPKDEHLKQFIELCARRRAFPAGREADEIRTFWRSARQKVLLDETWLHDLVGSPAPVPLFPGAEVPGSQREGEPAVFPRVDWVGALDVSHFRGREVELAELTQWIVQERCRLVVVLGMGGIGKSTLVSFLGQQLAPRFEAVLWRSVRDAPSCEELVADCIAFFSETPPAGFPTSLEQRINQLLARLQARRCLLVLDNLETLLEGGDREGSYLPGYEGYARLIQRLAESAHASCVLLTSREKPKEIEPLEGVRAPVRSLRLSGLDEQAAQELLTDKGLSGTPAAWRQLVASYAGNPLALKIVAQAISDLFNGDLDRFLQEGELIFNGVRVVLRQQVGRLTPLEHILLTWLAVLREWTPLETLLQVLLPRALRAQVLGALEALVRRSLLERGQQATFSLQSVVMEYITDALVEHLSEEIVLGKPQQVRRYALEQAQAKDYVRQTQVRLLVHPLIERLRAELGAEALVEESLLRLLDRFRSEDAATQGYGPANVISLLKELRGHLRGVDLSGLTIRGAYLQGVEMQNANLSDAHLQETVFTEAFDAILTVAISPDGRYWAAGSNSGAVRAWREEGRTLHLALRAHTDRVTAVAFAPDGTTLVTASWDGTVKLWDVASGAGIWTLRGHTEYVQSVAWSPDGRWLASSSTDGTIRIWNAKDGTCQRVLEDEIGAILHVAWSSDGRWLACGGISGAIHLWDVQEGAQTRTLYGHTNLLQGLAFAPDSSTLASCSYDRSIRLWEVETGVCRLTLEGHTGPVVAVAWSPDGTVLASCGYDTTVRLWDPASGQCRHILQGHSDAVLSLAFTPGGEMLLSGSYGRTLRVWETASGQGLRVLQGYAFSLFDLSWHPGGQYLAGGNSDATLTLWDVAERRPVQTLRGHTQIVFRVAWSPDGRMLASGSWDHTIRLWEVRTGACKRILQGHIGPVSAVAWSPDGRLLASSSDDETVRLWDVQEGVCLRMKQTHTGVMNQVAWSPDGTCIVSGGEDQTLIVWRVADGGVLQQLHGRREPINAIAWSPDGTLIASPGGSGRKGEIYLWDTPTGPNVRTLEGHTSEVLAIAWEPVGRFLLSGDAAGNLGWWDVTLGTSLAAVHAHDGWIRAISVSSDGKTVASCGEDGVIQLWDMASYQQLATLRNERPYERLRITGATGLTEAQKTALQALGALDAPTTLRLGP